MKIKTKLLFGSSLLLMLGACVGPGASAPSDSMDDYHGARSRGESTTDYSYSEDGSSTSPTSNNGSSSNNNMPKSGQLTCGAVDDNLTYSYWKELASSTQQGANEFASYKQKYAFNTFNRLQLKYRYAFG